MNLVKRSTNGLRSLTAAAVAAVALTASNLALATGPDFGTITDSLDTSTIVTSVFAGMALLIGVTFAIWGGMKIVGLFGRK